ncbi:MAG: hypothetical protein ACP5VS_00420 [Desulfomonilaceae bacterium]
MGAQEVVTAADAIATSLAKVAGALTEFNAALPGMGTGMTTLTTALDKLNPAMRRLATSMSIIARSRSSLQGLFSQVDRSTTTRAMKAASDAESAAAGGGNAILAATGSGRRRKSFREDRGVPLPDGVMPEEPKPKGGRAASQKGLNPAYFMLRWMAMSKAIQGMGYTGTSLLLGKSRDTIAAANMDLTAIDFDKVDKKKAELEGVKFSRQLPMLSTDQYMKAMSQAGSSFDVNETGFENINAITMSALKLAQLTKMKDPEKSVDLVTSQLNSIISRMTPEERDSKVSYKSDWLGNKAAEIVGQMNAAIRIFPTWGKNIQDFMAMGLGTMTAKGWDLPRQLAFLGSLQSPGFKASTIGRSARTILGKEGRTVAKLQMLDEGFTEFGDLKGKAREEALAQKWLAEMQANPDMGQLKAAQAYEKAKKLYADPFEKVSASRDFRSIMEFFFNQQFQQFMSEKRAIIEEEGRGGTSKIDKQLDSNTREHTTPYQHVANELNNLATAVAASEQAWNVATNAVSLFSKITDAVNRGNMVSASKDELITKFGGAKTAEDFEAYKKAKAEVAKKMKKQGSSNRDIQAALAEADWNILPRKGEDSGEENKAWSELEGRLQSIYRGIKWFDKNVGLDPWAKLSPEQLQGFSLKDKADEEVDALIRGDQVSSKPQTEAVPSGFGNVQSADQILSSIMQQQMNQENTLDEPARILKEAGVDLKQVASILAVLAKVPQAPASFPSQAPVVPGQVTTSNAAPGQGFMP